MLNAAIWNVRGLNKRDHQLAVKDIVAEFRLHFLDFLETRARINNVAQIQSFLLPHWKWFVDYGSSGTRVWIAWDANFIDVAVIESVIYGATEMADRRELWRSLETIPWLVGGDFNAVRDISEIRGASGDIRMAMEEFNICIQNAGFYHYPCRANDHSPLLLYGDRQQQLGGMFRFDILTLSPDFIPGVQRVWQHNIIGVPMYVVTRKLKALKAVVREQRRKKGDLTHNVQLAKGFLEMAQTLVSLNRRDELFLQLEHCCRIVLAKAAKLEQIAQRRSARRILQITDDQGVTHMDPGEVTNEFVSYYQNLQGGERRRDVIDIRFLRPWARHLLNEEDTSSLLLLFTPADVKQPVFYIAEDKAPGPDGYSSDFFKAAWPIVGQEVTSAVLDFFTTGRILKQINTTLLALIPKVHSPTSVSDFRPISCCNVLYKIIAKLLVQRLSEVLNKLISPCQAAFVPGRSIGDNIMLAQELFTRYNQARLPPRCALKVDIRKAYDTVEWDFLLVVLELFGFPTTFKSWIESCVTTPSFSVGLNRKPHGFFMGARGLRQARIFQLGFADDLLLFCRADMDRFAEWSSLRLNIQKSHLIISRSAKGLREEMLAVLGFQEGLLPMRYLGLPLLSSRLSIADCRLLLLKIDDHVINIHGGDDRINWRLSEGRPTTQALYRFFCPPGPKVGWSSLLSGSLKIPRHNFILWLAIQEKLPTTDKPWMTHLGRCILCDEGAEETHTHMFFRCRYSRGCLAAIRHHIRFAWPNREWTRDVEWASRKWRGKHIVNVAYRALLGACIYHIWRERNLRRFEHTHRPEAVLATCIIEDVRQRIISSNLPSSISTCALYRLWRIPWSVGGTPI
ncbi:UNVERIFIED_CONTAM: hypothetical protein Sindi_0723800 [Sesamum indicum]